MSKWRTAAAFAVPVIWFLGALPLFENTLLFLGLTVFIAEVAVVWPLTQSRRMHPALVPIFLGTLSLSLLLGLTSGRIDQISWLLFALSHTIALLIGGSLLIAFLIRQLASHEFAGSHLEPLWYWLQANLAERPGRQFWIVVLWTALISPGLALPIAILIAVFHWLKAEGKLASRLHQVTVLGIATTIAVVSYLDPFYLLPLLTGLNWILITTIGSLRYQLPRLSIGLKTVIVGITSAALMVELLFFSTFSLTFRLFVLRPDHLSLATDLSTWIRVAFSAIVALVTGPVAVIWGQPRGRLNQFIAGAVSLALAGGILFGYLGVPAAGVAAYAPLYGVGLSQNGCGGSDWMLRLATALNAVFPIMLGMTWLLIGGGALIGGMTGLLVPDHFRSTRHSSPLSLNALLSDLIGGGIANLQLVILILIVSVVVLGLLVPVIQGWLDAFGAVPSWSPQSSALAMFAQFWLILILWQVVALICLYRQGPSFTSLMLAARAYATYSATIYTIAAAGLVLAVFGMRLSDEPILLIASLITIALSAEIVSGAPESLRAAFMRDDGEYSAVPLPWQPGGWTGADMVAGLLTGILSYQFVAIILGIIFVAIPIIPQLGNTTDSPPGVEWLGEILLDYFITAPALFLGVAIIFVFASLSPFSSVYTPFHRVVARITDIDYVYHRSQHRLCPTAAREHISPFGKRFSRTIGRLLLVAAICGALVSIDTLVIAGLAAVAAFLLTRSLHLERLTYPMLILACAITLVGLIELASEETLLFPVNSLRARLAYALILGPAATISYRSVLAYAPGRSQLMVRVAILLGAGLLIMWPKYSSWGVVSIDGGVSSFNDQHWEVFTLENSAIGNRLNYHFFLDSQEHLWYGGGSGVIVERTDENWCSYLINSVTELSDQPREELLGARIHFVEDLSGRLWVARGTTFGQFDPAPETADPHLRVPSRPLTRDQADALKDILVGATETPLPTETEMANTRGSRRETLPKIQEPTQTTVALHTPITGMVRDAAGNLWLATTGDGAMRLEGGRELDDARWQFFTAENSGIASNDVRSVYADRAGNIWFGTTGGLSRFDGTAWKTIVAPGLGSGEPVVAFLEDSKGSLWVGTASGGNRFDGQRWTSFGEMDGWLGGLGTETLFEDSQGGLWAGTENGAFRFNGLEWINLVPNVYVTTFNDGSSEGIVWIGTRENLVRYNLETGEQEFFDSENSDITTGWVQDLHMDSDGRLWVSTFAASRTSRSLWWILGLVVLSFSYVSVNTYRGYRRAPEIHAGKLGQGILAKPDSLYSIIYGLLARSHEASGILTWVTYSLAAPNILTCLADYLALTGDMTGAEATAALAVLCSDLRVDEALEQSVAALEADLTRAWARSLYRLHSLLVVALNVHRVSDIVNLELTVNLSKATGGLSLWSSCEPVEALPPFLPQGSSEAWLTFEQVGLALHKYRKVDAAVDRLSYLAEALGAIDRAQNTIRLVGLPEGTAMAAVANRWRTVIADEINRIGGQAKLQLELRTHQVRRAARVALVLRLQNSGRAVAENIVVVFQPGEGVSPAGETQIAVGQLSSGNSTLVEFVIAPTDIEAVRVAFRVMWDDRVADDNEIEFADIVRFFEVAEEFHYTPNPYIVGHPVKSTKMFYGREDLFRFIADNLSGPGQDYTFLIHGQRRTGKTSILYQLQSGRLGGNYIPVLIDMQELTPFVNSTGDLLSEMAYQLTRSTRKAGVAVGEPMPEAFLPSPTRAFSRFLDVLEDSLGDQRVLIMFDEFELIESKIAAGKLDRDVLGYFRSLMQHRDRFVFFFTGTHHLEEMSHDYWSIFFNIVRYRRVSFLDPDEAARLIRDPIEGSLNIDELAVEKIINLTSGHPYFIQLLCWTLVNHCNVQQRNYATINDINEVLQEIMVSGEAHFAFIWQQTTSDERLALAGLAHTLRPGKIWARPSEILNTLAGGTDIKMQQAGLVGVLDGLTLQGVLEVAADGALRYRFRLDVLRLWIKVTKPIAAVLEHE